MTEATRLGDVIDAHVHVVSVGLLTEYIDSLDIETPGFRAALARRQWGRKAGVLPDTDPAQTAAAYLESLDASGIARAVVMSLVPDSAWLREFLRHANGRVVASARIDPRDPAAVKLLEREAASDMRGVKLLPVNDAYRLSDPACRPFFERLNELGLPATVHYGVSVAPTADLRFADPIDLSPVARDFPDTPFVIAHFGAGWFEQVLRLAYQCPNVVVDTSGTNNWLDSFVPRLTLDEVFEISLTALGPGRVVFGTDSTTATPYRDWIAFMQRRILEELGLGEAERDLVLRGNAARLWRL
jgi:hypothetical protein